MTPNDIERFGYGNEAFFLDLEQRIMLDVVRRLKDAKVITRTADFQLNRLSNLGYSDQEIKDMLQETLNASDTYIDSIYDKALKTEYIDNEALYKAAGKSFIPYEKNAFVRQLVIAARKQTKNEMRNITKTMGFVVNDRNGQVFKELSKFYRDTLDEAMTDITTGAFDYNTTLRKTVRQMTNSGIRWVDYESGHHNRIVVASRRSVFTGLGNLAGQMAEYNAEQLDTNDYEVAWHANARPTHKVWHGQVWSREELVTVCGLGTADGLLGNNCYHLYYPFIKGISKRNWSDSWLRQQNEKEDKIRTFGDKEYTAYTATQRQRVLETRMRAQRESIKLLQDGEGDAFDILTMQARYRATMDEYVQFSDAMGLRQQKERIYMDSLGTKGSYKKKGVLTKQERGALNQYISSDSYKINEKLRSKQPLSPEQDSFVRYLDAALSKTKTYKGEVNRSLSFMHDDDIKDYVNMHKPGFPVKYNQYISASTDLMYNEDGQVQMHILSKSGKDIRSYNEREKEILFDRDADFMVKHLSNDEGKWVIWLEEMKKNGK